MRTFYKLLTIGFIAATTNNFVWFALTYWAYLETKSVVSTGIVAGVWLVATAISGIWLGSLVDHHKKKTVMLGSSSFTLILFLVGLLIYISLPQTTFASVTSPMFWVFVLILLTGVISGNIYSIAIPTLVGITVPEEKRDKANGMFGTIMGISFTITAAASGVIFGIGGMNMVLIIAAFFTGIAILTLSLTNTKEKSLSINTEESAADTIKETKKKVDLKGTIKIVGSIPGLFPLIFFTTFNNFLGGVFMALMDAYGLTLVSVQVWGILWAVLSSGFILGGMHIAKRGLGKNPLATLFRINIIMWTVCIFFTIQPSITLLASGMFIWLCLVPFVEATEQTIMQKVVPPERLGRVFGFAHSVEQSTSPITAFLIGPIAQFIFIPFMTTGKGVDLIGDWFGTGTGRGIALVFITAGIIGLLTTLIAQKTKYYRLLSEQYLKR